MSTPTNVHWCPLRRASGVGCSGGACPSPDHERSERARATLEAIAALPPREREALVRTSIHGDSGRETALALGVSEDVVRQLVHRARRRARAALRVLLPVPLGRLAGHGGEHA